MTTSGRTAERDGEAEYPRPLAAGVPLLRWTYGLVNRIVAAGDITLICASSLALMALSAGSPTPLSLVQSFVLTLFEATAFTFILGRMDAYRVEKYVRFWATIGDLAGGLLGAWAVVAVFFAAFRPPTPLDWRAWALFLAIQAGLLTLARGGARLLWRGVRERKLLRRNVVLIGANPAGEAILERLLTPADQVNYHVVAVFADASDRRQAGILRGIPILGDIDMLGVCAQTNVIDLVIVALPIARAAQTVALIEDLKWIAADVVIPMEEIGLRPSFARLTNVAGTSTLQVLDRPLKGSQAVLKIIEDYLVASLALVFVSPLMLIAALAIRLDSNGPVFFKQDRTGFGNNTFRIYKFRTMTVDPTDDGSVGTDKRRHNPRITRVGGILRRLSIDELPQLFNVLRGEMSIVGPRPYVPNMLVGNDTFRRVVQNYAFRYRLKPGMTGLAQVKGLRSSALRSLANAERSIDLDLHYIAHWSLWLDLKIILQTIPVAIAGRGVV